MYSGPFLFFDDGQAVVILSCSVAPFFDRCCSLRSRDPDRRCLRTLPRVVSRAPLRHGFQNYGVVVAPRRDVVHLNPASSSRRIRSVSIVLAVTSSQSEVNSSRPASWLICTIRSDQCEGSKWS